MICLQCLQSGQLFHHVVFDTLWAVNVSNLSLAEHLESHEKTFHSFTASLISYWTNGSFPVDLRDNLSCQHTPTLFEFIHLLHIAGIFCKYWTHGNYYSVTTSHSVCFDPKVYVHKLI